MNFKYLFCRHNYVNDTQKIVASTFPYIYMRVPIKKCTKCGKVIKL